MNTEVQAGEFEKQFQNRLDNIEARGKAVGLTLTHICRDSGIARATPDRWRKDTPLSIKLMDQMEAIVIIAEQKSK
jgi:enamine deaminase RidA (YjgF/YER057c/UK114 family)